MANFCKFCGKSLVDGKCDCPGFVAASEEKAKEQLLAAMQMTATQEMGSQPTSAAPQPTPVAPQPTPAAPQPNPVPQQAPYGNQVPPAQGYQAPPSQPVVSIQGDAVKAMLINMKDLFLGFLKNPVATLQSAYASPDKVSQYLLAAVFAIVTLIFVPLLVTGISKGILFKAGFMLALAVVACRAVYAVAVYFMAKRYNPSLNLSTTLGLFCVTFIYDTIAIVLVLLAALIGLVEISLAFMMLWFVMMVLSATIATQVLCLNQTENACRITIIVQAVLLIIVVFIVRGIILEIIGSMVGSMMGGMMNYY